MTNQIRKPMTSWATILCLFVLAGPGALLVWHLAMRGVVPPRVSHGTARELLSRDVRPFDRLAWSHDGAYLATCSRHGDVHLWRTSSSNVRHASYVFASLSFADYPTGLAWNGDGTILALLACEKIAFFDVANDRAIRSGILARGATDLAWCEVRNAVVYSRDRGLALCLTNGDLEALAGMQPAPIRSIDVEVGGNRIVSVGAQGTCAVWDVRTMALARQLSLGSAALTAVKWRPKDGGFVVGAEDGAVSVWSLDGKTEVTLASGSSSGKVVGLCFSESGLRLAAAYADKRVVIWSLETAQATMSYEGFSNHAIAWRPAHDSVAVGGDGQVWEWVLTN